MKTTVKRGSAELLKDRIGLFAYASPAGERRLSSEQGKENSST